MQSGYRPREVWGAGAHGKPSVLSFLAHFVVTTNALSHCTRAGGDEEEGRWQTGTGGEKGRCSGDWRRARMGAADKERVRRARMGAAAGVEQEPPRAKASTAGGGPGQSSKCGYCWVQHRGGRNRGSVFGAALVIVIAVCMVEGEIA